MLKMLEVKKTKSEDILTRLVLRTCQDGDLTLSQVSLSIWGAMPSAAVEEGRDVPPSRGVALWRSPGTGTEVTQGCFEKNYARS